MLSFDYKEILYNLVSCIRRYENYEDYLNLCNRGCYRRHLIISPSRYTKCRNNCPYVDKFKGWELCR